MGKAPDDWKKSAVAITPGFEVSGDPYQGVSGDFDGMGISCGALQWNIGQGSLQPMVKAVGKQVVTAAMPIYGTQLWTACTGPTAAGLKIVRRWQTNQKLNPKARAELKAFMGSDPMRAQQDAKIDVVATAAYDSAADWAKAKGDDKPSKRLFCWFFDLVTQNGGLEGVTHKAVKYFIALNKPERTDDLICDFLAAQTGRSGHAKDAVKNAKLWRNKPTGEKLELLTLSYLRSKTANPKWRHVVVNRKGSIAMGGGWVNSSLFDFSAHSL